MISVAIAEDDYLVSQGIQTVLRRSDDIVVVGTATDPDGFEAVVADHHVDVAVLDVRMPPTHTTEGIALARRLRERDPGIGVVILSQHHDPEYALELLGDGSEGKAYLLKERLGDADELVSAIAEVHRGGSVLDPKIVDALLTARRRRANSRVAGLTPREMEVLGLMASGKGNSAIADALVISERAVEKHSNAIFGKLGLREADDLNRRVAAVLFFLQRTPD
ncbi:response regulator [Euzebya sp.]|uniref:response regulator transcription factor n=1 Tax=Euzebya sp. TaxID=1971409 RepID=UPI003518136D